MRVAPSQARLRGVEFLLRGDPSRRWTWWASYVRSSAEDRVDDQWVVWQNEIVYSSFNLYRGVLSALRLTGVYTQYPDEPDAERFCDRVAPDLLDPFVPPAGEGVFYLVTGESDGGESGLGPRENGEPRPNTSPCP